MRKRRSSGTAGTIVAVLFMLALHSVLGEDAAVLTAPGQLFSGGNSAVTLVVFDEQSRQPVDRSVRLDLVSLTGSAWTLYSGSTGISGQLRIPFSVPDAPSGAYTLRAVLGGSVVLQANTEVSSSPAILIETDKPIYRPGQTIRGRVVRLSNDLLPVAGPVELILLDGKGIRITREQLEADEFGVADFALELASELNQGVWRVRARSDSVESVRDIRVEEYVLPRFEMNLVTERTWALVNEPINGEVEARFFYGKAVQGKVELVASRWVGTWQEYSRKEGTLEEGFWSFQLPAVGYVIGTPQSGGQGSVRLDVTVTDSTGHSQSITDSLVIAQAPVNLTLRSSSARLKGGLPLSIHVTAETPDGFPVDTGLRLGATFYDNVGSELSVLQAETTTAQGSVLWPIVPPERTLFADFQATPNGFKSTTLIRVAGMYSPSESFLSLIRVDGSSPLAVGETARFETISNSKSPVYYEVYAGGRTVFSDFTETGTFAFPITTEMVPVARVVAYQISPSNEVFSDSLALETLFPLSATLEASFDADQVQPGESVEVIIDTGMNRRTLLGVSIVDQSVLYLGRSRLHLAQVFDELERRFMEPLAEVHFENDLPPLMGVPFSEPVLIVATREVFAEVGLVLSTTGNLGVPTGGQFDFGAPINLSPPPLEGGAGAAAPEKPRLRQFFPETWLWEPLLLTDDEGKARLSLQAPDNITGWRLAVVATQPDPGPEQAGIAFGEAELIAFQDFFVEPSLPVSVVRGEAIPLKVDIFNYLEEPQKVELELQEAEGLEILGEKSLSLTVGAESAVSAEIPIRPTGLGDLPIQLSALGSQQSDAVLRRLRVLPEGFPVEDVLNGILKAESSVSLVPEVPVDAVSGSVSAFVSITPSPVAQTMQGVSDLLAMPYGCGEQNMIFLAPDIEILKYLREIGELNPEIRAEAEQFINVGYQRQLTFQTDDGGFAAFGGPDGSLWLTAFVLSTFSSAREVRDIDETILQQAAAMILARQQDDGSFALDEFLIHTEMAGGVANLYTMAAYVANALADYGGEEIADALARAAGFLENNRSISEIWTNAYPLSIASVALLKVPGFEAAGERILDRLLELAIADGLGLHWEPYPVETTGYAALALLSSNQGTGRPQAQEALDWLTTQRNSLGGYGQSTQDTVVALRALFVAAARSQRNLDLRIDVLGRYGILTSFFIDETNFDLLHRQQVPVDQAPFELRSSGVGTVGYQLATRFNLPGSRIPPSSGLTFDVEYDTQHVEIDDIVDVAIRLTYTGLKGHTGMVIADVSVPTGFEVIAGSLESLVKDGLVQRVEQAGRKLIFYIERLDRDVELAFSFQILALYPVRSMGQVAQAYEYYDSSVSAYRLMEPVQILDGAVAPPTVDSVSQEASAAGEEITITGSGFLSGPVEVLFNGVAALILRVIDDQTLVVTVPNLPPGEVKIEVVTPGGVALWSSSVFVIQPFRLFYPLYPNQQGSFTGYAFTNYSGRGARLDLTAYDPEGNELQLPKNPQSIELGLGRQLAGLEQDLFLSPFPSVVQPGWIELRADNAEIGSLFQFGNRKKLDGASPFSSPAQELWFTRIFDGPSSYRGTPAATWLTVANPGTDSVSIRLTLIEPATTGGSTTERFQTLAPRAALYDTASSIFGKTEIEPGAFVKAEVTEGEGIVGFGRTELLSAETSLGLAAAIPNGSSRLWSAQLATGPGVFTSVRWINTASENRRIQVRMIGEDGAPYSDPVVLDLAPSTAVEKSFLELLGLGNAPEVMSGLQGSYLVGSLTVEADGPGVIGDVLFGDPDTHRNAAVLPLQSETFKKALFSHLADSAGFFTGVALHNPGSAAASVSMRVHRIDGTLTADRVIMLAAGARISKELGEFMPEVRGQLGGYLIVESTQPLVAQELFGDRGLATLSAVPPTVVRQ